MVNGLRSCLRSILPLIRRCAPPSPTRGEGTTRIRLEQLFWLFSGLHVLLWTLAPALIRLNLPMDAMEGTTWGHQLEWGYDKNPYLNAWLTALAVKGNATGWITYFFSQLSVAAAFWALWQLGKKILSPAYALISVFLLESIQYYNLHTLDFNDNTLEIGLWALTLWFFYSALEKASWKNWLLCGLFAGLGLMTKYYTALLLLPMGLLLLYPEHRHQFKKPTLYGGLIIFILVTLPHFIWLFFNNFITLQYAVNRVSSPPSLWNHFYFPAQFGWQQIETFLPVLALILFVINYESLTGSRGQAAGRQRQNIDTEQQVRDSNTGRCEHSTFSNKRFLLWLGLGPFLLTLLLSATMGMKLRAAWGQPLLSLWCILLLFFIMPYLSLKHFYKLVTATFVLMGVLVMSYGVALMKADEISSAFFPGKQIAQQLTNEWHTRYGTPIPYVAGPRWLAGNIAFYSPDHPAVYIDFNRNISPWIDEKKFKKSGAIMVWDPTESQQVSFMAVKKRYPALKKLSTRQFAWLRNPTLKPMTIQVAYLPPSQS